MVLTNEEREEFYVCVLSLPTSGLSSEFIAKDEEEEGWF